MAIATIPRAFAEALAGTVTGVVADATNAVRDGVARSVRLRLAEDPAGPEIAAYGDVGWFGPDSVAWRVHGDLSTLTGGLRALLYQTLHPLAMAGVADHSDYRRDPWGRLRRTAQFVAATTYGTSEEAEAAVARVRRVHEHVRGTSPDGRAYSADRPDLLAWVHATEVDSFLAAYRRYGPGLDDAEADRYVDEMAVVARAFGADPVPTSTAELHDVLGSYSLHATRRTRETVRFLMVPPLPLAARPTYGLIATAAVELLPWSAQRELRLVVPPIAGPLGVRPATQALLGALRWALGTSPALATAHARVAGAPVDSTYNR
ncbi:MAG TPA: oxygenase MpaB family protein [Acidimicrobiia bacterium]|nr:oxygenase MpaB family protein [Acidimicrobiia bacterium]